MTERTQARRTIAAALVGLLVAAAAVPAAAQTAKARFEAAMSRDARLRPTLDAGSDLPAAERMALLREVTRAIAAYEGIVRRFPASGYCDDALWQGGLLAEASYRRFGRADDRGKALQLYGWLIREYPSSPLVRRARAQVAELERVQSVEAALPAAGTEAAPQTASVPPAAVAATTRGPVLSAAPAGTEPAIGSNQRATLTAIDHSVLPDAVRITLTLDREVAYRDERLSYPDRVFFDLRGAQAIPALVDATLSYADPVVPQVRTGRHPNGTVRVVIDLREVARYSVFTLYNPFRIVADFERAATGVATVDERDGGRTTVAAPGPAGAGAAAPPLSAPLDSALAPLPSPGVPAVPPASARTNLAGGYSLSRQLGLGISRIVIDPGHGGHDPGASAHGLREADVTLDLALRLERLLLAEPGVEVILTRRTDTYVPLEERTAVANREAADLFLSIHANASRNPSAHGVETYYLSFAATPDAEAVAARENAASGRSMHSLPDIIRAIALNNKLDESRDLAGLVQEAMATRLRRVNRDIRNLGVKKAPFVVLIGAAMPSVLAEVSFLTNRHEAQLLKTDGYRQRIAEALHAAVMKYRSTLKRQSTVADRDQP